MGLPFLFDWFTLKYMEGGESYTIEGVLVKVQGFLGFRPLTSKDKASKRCV